MNCQDCKKLLSKFLDNELDKKQQEVMIKHIEDCPVCAQSLESITEMVNIMHKIKAVNPPADFIENVNKRLDQLPFWDKVLIGVRSVFFQNPPVKVFAMMATLVLVFAVTSQLNIYPKKTENRGVPIALKKRNALESGRQRREHAVTAEKAKKTIIIQECAEKKEMLCEPSSADLESPKTETADSLMEIAHDEDKENSYIKANNQQVLILSLDDKSDSSVIKEMLYQWKVIDLSLIKQNNVDIFSFKITYANFLRLHSVLAGLGQLEKATPNVELYENIDQSMSWQEQAFQQLISVKLKVL